MDAPGSAAPAEAARELRPRLCFCDVHSHLQSAEQAAARELLPVGHAGRLMCGAYHAVHLPQRRGRAKILATTSLGGLRRSAPLRS